MVDKKLSDFQDVTIADVAKLVCLYLDENNATKNGKLDFSTFDGSLVHKAGTETITGDKTFSGDTVFSGGATFNQDINANISGSSASCTGNAATATSATNATNATNDGDGNNIATSLSNKCDIDWGNVNNTGKARLGNWVDASYSDAISGSLTSSQQYTTPKSGWLWVRAASSSGNTEGTVKISGTTVGYFGWFTSGVNYTVLVHVAKNRILKATFNQGTKINYVFFPAQGG